MGTALLESAYTAMVRGMKKAHLLLLLTVFVAGSCRKADIRTVVIQVPGMKNEACAKRVSNAAASEVAAGPRADANSKRVQAALLSGSVKADLATRTVTVRYDSLRMSLKNLEFAIAKAGFDANNTPARPSAVEALPAECK